MRTPSDAPSVFPPGGGRRRLVRGGIVVACLLYVGVLLLLPLAGIVYTALEPGWSKVVETFSRPDVQHAFFLTGVITVITVAVTTFFGVITAWVLVRQRFVGKSLLNALVDLPFALSPVTVGLAAVILFGSAAGSAFFEARGIQVIFAVPSMVLVTIFICIPFTIREVVPVLEEIGKDEGMRRAPSARRSCRRGAGSPCRTSAGASSTASRSRSRVRSARSAPC